MSEIMTAVRASCSCGIQRAPFDPQDQMTVPAGSVSGGLGVCGYPSELSRLPVTYIRGQEYREGFCPDTALEVGTLFPELADEYR